MTIKEKSRYLYESLQKRASINFWHVKKMKYDFISIFLSLNLVIFLNFLKIFANLASFSYKPFSYKKRVELFGTLLAPNLFHV